VKFFGVFAIYTMATTLPLAAGAQAAAMAGNGANGERRAAFASERRAAFANSLTDEEPRAERNSERRQQPTPPASLQQSQRQQAVLQQALRPPVVEEFMFRGSYTTEECAICFDEVHLRRTSCKHAFCEECLVKYVHTWVVNEARGLAKWPLRCPVCRVGLTPFDVPARARHLMVRRELVQPNAADAAGGGGAGGVGVGGRGPLQPPQFLEEVGTELSLKACICCCISVGQLITHAARCHYSLCVLVALFLWALVLAALAFDGAVSVIDVPNQVVANRTAGTAGGAQNLFRQAVDSEQEAWQLEVALRLCSYVAVIVAWCAATCLLETARRYYRFSRSSLPPSCCVPCLAASLLHRLGLHDSTYVLTRPLCASRHPIPRPPRRAPRQIPTAV